MTKLEAIYTLSTLHILLEAMPSEELREKLAILLIENLGPIVSDLQDMQNQLESESSLIDEVFEELVIADFNSKLNQLKAFVEENK